MYLYQSVYRNGYRVNPFRFVKKLWTYRRLNKNIQIEFIKYDYEKYEKIKS